MGWVGRYIKFFEQYVLLKKKIEQYVLIFFLSSTCYLDYWRYLHVSAAAAETGEISLVLCGARDLI